ncbi:MAG: DUF6502 family protein [Pseudomonadota bacterium]
MRSATQEKILDLLFKALRPLAHLLIESGIGHREFAEVAKRAYVDVASKNYGIRGRSTNISRVAVMTGLTRKEVKRVRDELSGGFTTPGQKPIPASTILASWHEDPKYCDENGMPLDLPFESSSVSFAELVREYAGDIPPGAIRTELVRVGSAEVLANGSIRALRKYYIAPEGSERLIRALDWPLALMAKNIRQNNVSVANAKNQFSWPETIVWADNMDRGRAKEIRDFSFREITGMAEELDEKLSELRESTKPEKREDVTAFGVGFYFFEAD